MRKLITSIILAVSTAISLAEATTKKTITVNQFVSHVALDEAYKGLIDGLHNHGLTETIELIHGNAGGNIPNSAQLARHQASLSPDLMVAIATPSAQATLKARGGDTLFAFLAVTDPAGANLTGKRNVYGVSDSPPIKELLDLLPSVFPDIKKIGAIYNSGEINSINAVERMEELAKLEGIQVIHSVVNNSSDIKNAMANLIGNVDTIYIPQDNTVVAAFDSVAKIARENKMPIVSNIPSLTDRGALISLGANYYQNGEQLASMIADLFQGNKVDPQIQQPSKYELQLNLKSAKLLGITIDESVQKMAGRIVK